MRSTQGALGRLATLMGLAAGLELQVATAAAQPPKPQVAERPAGAERTLSFSEGFEGATFPPSGPFRRAGRRAPSRGRGPHPRITSRAERRPPSLAAATQVPRMNG